MASNDTFVAGQSNNGDPTLAGASETAVNSGSWTDSLSSWFTGAEKVVTAANGVVQVLNGGKVSTESKPATTTGTVKDPWYVANQKWIIGGAVALILGLFAFGMIRKR
jgi:hypothetical protein